MSTIDIEPIVAESLEIEKYSYQSIGATISAALANMRISFGSFSYQVLLPSFLVMTVVTFVLLKFRVMAELSLFDLQFVSWPNGLLILILTSFVFVWLMILSSKKSVSLLDFMKAIKSNFLLILPLAGLYILGSFYGQNNYLYILVTVMHLPFIFIMLEEISKGARISFSFVRNKYKFSLRYWFDFFPITLALIIFVVLGHLLMETPFLIFITDFIYWHNIFDNVNADVIYIDNLLKFLVYFIPIPLFYFAFTYRYGSVLCLVNSVDLIDKLPKFGQKEHNYRLHK